MTQIMMVVVGAIMILVGIAISITVPGPAGLIGCVLSFPGGMLAGSGIVQLMMQ